MSPEILINIQKADLVPLLSDKYSKPRDGKRQRPMIAPYMQRAVMLAIVVETVNGQRPLPTSQIAERAGMSENCYRIVCRALVRAKLLKRDGSKSVRREDLAQMVVHKVVEGELAKIRRVEAPVPLAKIADPAGLAIGKVLPSVLELRSEALVAEGLGVADVTFAAGYLGVLNQTRVYCRGRLALRMRAMASARGDQLPMRVLAAALGCEPASVKYAVKQYQKG